MFIPGARNHPRCLAILSVRYRAYARIAATLANDAVEAAAIKDAFGLHAFRVPVRSTKAMNEHLPGAAGALEFVAAVTSNSCALGGTKAVLVCRKG